MTFLPSPSIIEKEYFIHKTLRMTKQEYLLAVIDAMPDWEMGRGIKAMIENNQLEEPTIDKLVIIFKKMIDNINDIVKKYRIIKQIKTTKKLNAQKAHQAKQDQVELKKLDAMLDNF